MADSSPTISVIIPVYNGEKFLPSCLDALVASDHPSYELIVVDDGSTDNSAAIALGKGANVITSKRPRSGPATARNLAAEQATGEILLFVDADVVVERNSLSQVAERFREQPEISALFGSYDDDPGEQNFLSQYRNLLHHFVHQYSNAEASTFWTGLGAIRRDVFLSVGGFDNEKFEVPSIEDIELGVRLRSKGYRILLAKAIQAKHLKRWTASSILRTDILCRAIPWSKLILTNQGLINDLNLRTSDRLSSVLIGLSAALLPFTILEPMLLFVVATFLLGVAFLNRRILIFFARKKGLMFAVLAFPWQCLYFFYSGVVFVISWFYYVLPQSIGVGKRKATSEAGRTS